MDQVVIERPRGWRKMALLSKRAHRRTARVDENDDDAQAQAHESIKPYRERKSLSDLLGPLRRFLASREGKRWDKVYSELREHLSPRSTTQQHIFGHLWQYVEKNAVMNALGRPHALVNGQWLPVVSHGDCDRFYVHPRSGALLRAPRGSRYPRVRARDDDVAGRAPTRVIDGAVYALFAGAWFAPTMAPFIDGAFDVVSGAAILEWTACARYGARIYAASKGHQLGKKELRALALVNEAPRRHTW